MRFASRIPRDIVCHNARHVEHPLNCMQDGFCIAAAVLTITRAHTEPINNLTYPQTNPLAYILLPAHLVVCCFPLSHFSQPASPTVVHSAVPSAQMLM